MEQITYESLETQHSGMKVLLEFCNETDKDAAIRQEIKSILTSVLEERTDCLLPHENSVSHISAKS